MAKIKKSDKILFTIIILIIIIFGIFIIYNIIQKIIGGSWGTENIVISLLILNLSCVFTIGIGLAKLKSNHSNLYKQFKSLAHDFKEHIKK